MAKHDAPSQEQREIIRAQNDALLRWPADRDARLKFRADLRLIKARENDKIAQVKKDSGYREAEKHAIEAYGTVPQTLKIMNILAKMPPMDRAACCRQVMKAMEDEDYILPDLFDAGAIGVGSNDVAGETAGFDATSEAKRRGGDTAQPRTVEQMAASNAQAGTGPGIPLDEAERRLEEYRAKNPPKRGAKPKELKELEAQVEAARAAQPASDGPADLPEAKPGEVTAALREGAAESEQHIREAVAGPGAPPPETAAEPAAKPKRGGGKKGKAAAAAPPPPAPPEEAAEAAEDEEDDTIDVGTAPVQGRPDAIGSAPSTFRMG